MLGEGKGISCNGKWSLTKRFHTVLTTYQTTLLDEDEGQTMMG